MQTLSPNNRGRLFLGRGVLTGRVKEPGLGAWFRSPGGVVVSPDGTCVYSVLSGASAFDQGTQPQLLLFSESSSLRWLLNSVSRPVALALCISYIRLPYCPHPITPLPPPFALFDLKGYFRELSTWWGWRCTEMVRRVTGTQQEVYGGGAMTLWQTGKAY